MKQSIWLHLQSIHLQKNAIWYYTPLLFACNLLNFVVHVHTRSTLHVLSIVMYGIYMYTVFVYAYLFVVCTYMYMFLQLCITTHKMASLCYMGIVPTQGVFEFPHNRVNSIVSVLPRPFWQCGPLCLSASCADDCASLYIICAQYVGARRCAHALCCVFIVDTTEA